MWAVPNIVRTFEQDRYELGNRRPLSFATSSVSDRLSATCPGEAGTDGCRRVVDGRRESQTTAVTHHHRAVFINSQ